MLITGRAQKRPGRFYSSEKLNGSDEGLVLSEYIGITGFPLKNPDKSISFKDIFFCS